MHGPQMSRPLTPLPNAQTTYCQTKKLTDHVFWIEHNRKRHKTNRAKENAYWTMCLFKCSSQLGRLWHMMSSILSSSDARRIKTSQSAQTFLEFFNENVEAVRRAIGGSPDEFPSSSNAYPTLLKRSSSLLC